MGLQQPFKLSETVALPWSRAAKHRSPKLLFERLTTVTVTVTVTKVFILRFLLKDRKCITLHT